MSETKWYSELPYRWQVAANPRKVELVHHVQHPPIVLNVGKNLYFITLDQQYLYKCKSVRLECMWGKGGMTLHQQKEVSGYLNAPAQEEVSRRVRSIGDLQVLEYKKKVSPAWNWITIPRHLAGRLVTIPSELTWPHICIQGRSKRGWRKSVGVWSWPLTI